MKAGGPSKRPNKEVPKAKVALKVSVDSLFQHVLTVNKAGRRKTINSGSESDGDGNAGKDDDERDSGMENDDGEEDKNSGDGKDNDKSDSEGKSDHGKGADDDGQDDGKVAAKARRHPTKTLAAAPETTQMTTACKISSTMKD